jgi:hypothetical protein
MNTHEQNKEEAFAEELRGRFAANTYVQKEKEVRPTEELLRSTLQKISKPILSTFSWGSFVIEKKKVLSFAAIALLLIAGGVGVMEHMWSGAGSNAPVLTMNEPGDTSDTALGNDVAVIDSQLDGLNADNAATDQVLGQYSH